ncbi:hypothetical protein KDL01_26740 [Actinospica durhamensis]|uniref:Uncharacterized protein n=1 Tax=Actinospica durhamensis TaxID=1508375 RepID=A0A941EXN8_9ACTN|nr:hypothetical protein [Actinospica durhamensis]MBR7836904.1 hypothetical protein [Actinospica durhamensis]
MKLKPEVPARVLSARLRNGLSSVVPRTHARTLPQLRAAYPGLAPDELAGRLVADATRTSTAVGAALACAAFAPIPASATLITAGESATTSALRVRLTAELHAAYGLLDPSPVNEGKTGHLAQWAARDSRGMAMSLAALPAVALTLTRALPKKLRQRARLRTLFTASAVSAGLHSGRATRQYGEALRRDLSADPTAWSRWPDEPAATPPRPESD